MAIETVQNLTERLRAALDEGRGGQAVAEVLRDAHPADIAQALLHLEPPEALAAFEELDGDRAAEVLDELDPDLTRYLVEHAPPGWIEDLLDRLPMDDAAEVVSEAPEARERLLAALAARAPEDAREVRDLLAYPERTAGRLMTD